MPVAIAARLGAHTPDGEKTLGKIMPSAASRLRLGVSIVESPKGGIQALMSSVTSHNILGRPSRRSCQSVVSVGSVFTVVVSPQELSRPKAKKNIAIKLEKVVFDLMFKAGLDSCSEYSHYVLLQSV